MMQQRYQHEGMLVYDSRTGSKVFICKHVPPKYWRRIDVEEIDLARLSSRRLDADIKRSLGEGFGFDLVTHIADGHPSTTHRDTYHRQSPHRHKDSSPKSLQAKHNNHMFEHTLRLIDKVLSAALRVMVIIGNPCSKAFPWLLGVQQVLAQPG